MFDNSFPMIRLLFFLYLFPQNDQFFTEYDNENVVKNLLAIRDDLDYINRRQINPFIKSRLCQYNIDLTDSSRVVWKFTRCWQGTREYTSEYLFFNKQRELYRLIRYDSVTVNGRFFSVSRWNMRLTSKGGDSNFKDSVFWTSYSFARKSGESKYEFVPFTSERGRFKYRASPVEDSVSIYKDPILFD